MGVCLDLHALVELVWVNLDELFDQSEQRLLIYRPRIHRIITVSFHYCHFLRFDQLFLHRKALFCL